MFYGWFFESTQTACEFPGPLPTWLFEISDLLTDLLLFTLCGQWK